MQIGITTETTRQQTNLTFGKKYLHKQSRV
jgi:hypothetical protein